jgi:hypothetical protein
MSAWRLRAWAVMVGIMDPRRLLVLPIALAGCDPAGDREVPEGRPNGLEASAEVDEQGLGAPRGMVLEGPGGWTMPTPGPLAAIKAPLPAAYCQINVNGVLHDTETDYVPHVVQCENGGANFEALKAQAIAARSVAYYSMANDGKICDGQGCQVYSCNVEPTQAQLDAAKATAGQYLSFNGWLTYAFYVAGDPNTAPPSCVDTDNASVSATEKWVTFNNGKTGYDVDQTALGFKFPEDLNAAGYGQNRGCMSQWGARCQENKLGKNSTDILKFYYGADIKILQAEGACVVPPNEVATGSLDEVSCTQVRGWAFDADSGAAAIDVKISFGGPLGDPAAVTITRSANEQRDDLCDVLGSCTHGFTQVPVPRSLLDLQPHPVHAYAVDPQADPVELAGSAKSLNCPPPALPEGVRRLTSPEVLTDWQFDPFWQMARVDEATLAAIAAWKPVPPSPLLMRVEGDPAVWLSDSGFRRHVPSPEVAAAWRLNLDAAVVWPLEDLMMMPEGTPLRPEPFLVSGPGPAVYLLDDPQCPAGGDENDPQCPPPDPSGGSDGSTGGSSGGSEGGSVPTEGSAGSQGSSDGGSSGTGGPPWDSGPALPPGYGEEAGCRVDRGPQGAPWMLVVAGLGCWRRRRTRVR